MSNVAAFYSVVASCWMVGEHFMLLTDFSKAFDAVFHNIITRQADSGLGK